jgi:hypothetical protein
MGTVLTWSVDDHLPSTEQHELCRIRGEYLEMPGLCLTRCQAQRLWGLPCDRCDALLAALVEERFLVRTNDGRFILRGGGGR